MTSHRILLSLSVLLAGAFVLAASGRPAHAGPRAAAGRSAAAPARTQAGRSAAAAARAHPHPCPSGTVRARAHVKILFGDRRVEKRPGGTSRGVVAAFPVRSTESGTASSLCVYLDRHTGAKSLVAGLYSNHRRRPGSLLAWGSLVAPRAGAWNLIHFNSAVIHSQWLYWIALVGERGSVIVRQRFSRTCHATGWGHGMKSLPSTGRRGSRFGSCPVSAYVIGTGLMGAAPPTSPAPPAPAPAPTPPPAPSGPSMPACTQTMPAGGNLNNTLHSAPAGAVVCVPSGTYTSGLNLSGINPASTVTVRPADGAKVDFAGNGLMLGGTVQHLAVTGFSAPSNLSGGLGIAGGNGTIAHIAFTYDNFDGSGGPGNGQVGIQNLPANSDITLAHNTFVNISPCVNGCGEGAINLSTSNGSNDPDGVTIANNLISSGLSDGITWGGNESGTRILNNEITGHIQGGGSACSVYGGNCPHTDGMQFVGDARDVVISGNYMHNNTDSILQADGSNTNVTVTNNVFAVADTSIRSIQVSGWHGGTFSHNTVNSMATWDCTHDNNCTSGVTVTNNILQGGIGPGVQSGGGQFATEDYNITSGCVGNCGPHDLHGTASFQGGSRPNSYVGWALAAGSLGFGTASDGGNRGANKFSVAPGP